MEEPRQLGRYQLKESLGVGTMGTVYRARDESLGRDVAIKTIHTLGRSAFQLEVFQRRFDHEARALATLSHPNVVNVFDVGVEDGTPYLVMELVEGRSLADCLAERGRLGPDEVRALGRQLAAALEAAHARSIVHRDVKPANVLEAGAGSWKLADFGVAHVPESSLTLTGQFIGSPAYAAPEALEHGAFGPASDVFGLGATLYEALAGAPPFSDRGLGQLAEGAAPRPIPGAPADLERAIAGALERDPERRLTARQLAAALGATGSPRSWKPAAIAAGVAILVVGIALGASLGGGDPPARPAALPGMPAAPPVEREVDHRNAKDWRKVEEKLRDGKLEPALEHLDKILSRDPEDREARALFRELAGYEWGEAERWDDDWDD